MLITGVSGLLGSNLAFNLSDRFEIAGTYHSNPMRFNGYECFPMDLKRADETWSIIRRVKPQMVIHCAAQTGVDYCEEQPEEAFRVNVEGTESLAKAAAHAGSKFVYISTDSIFDGETGGYREDAKPGPVNVYAESKLLGERATQSYAEDHLIIRTNIYGWNVRPKLSLAEWILDGLENGRQVPAFSDIYFSPILVNDLAEVLAEMVAADLTGIYHVAAADRCTKFDFARMVCQTFEKDPELVCSAGSEEVGLKALRPKDTSLDVTKVSKVLGKSMPTVSDGIRRFRLLKENGYVDRLRATLTQGEVN